MFVELNYLSKEAFKKTVFNCRETSLDDTPREERIIIMT